ncbi:MAG: histidine kinase, partial [Caldisericum exile]
TLFQLKALQSRINPHFLFNSLNTISYITRTDPEKGGELVKKLSFILRKTIEAEETLSTLDEEISLVKAYLEIEKERFKEHLNYEFNIDSSLYDIKIPALILQPIVENAVKHGFSLTKRNVTIKIIAYGRGNYVYLVVEDNGKGISEETLKTIFNSSENKKSFGLKNVRDRVLNLFGSNAMFKIKSKINEGTKVIIGIPKGGTPNWILERLSSMTKNLQGKS